MEYILPYAADPEKKWPNQQIKTSAGLRTTFPVLLRRAAIAFKDRRYEDLAKKILGGQLQNERMQLLYPLPEKMNGQGRMN